MPKIFHILLVSALVITGLAMAATPVRANDDYLPVDLPQEGDPCELQEAVMGVIVYIDNEPVCVEAQASPSPQPVAASSTAEPQATPSAVAVAPVQFAQTGSTDSLPVLVILAGLLLTAVIEMLYMKYESPRDIERLL